VHLNEEPRAATDSGFERTQHAARNVVRPNRSAASPEDKRIQSNMFFSINQ
jgi:hypothetical protein